MKKYRWWIAGAVLLVLAMATIFINFKMANAQAKSDNSFDLTTEIANQDNYDFQLFPGETVASAMKRADVAGTGLVYVDDQGVATIEGDQMYVTKVTGEYPKYSIEVMYMWKKSEGAEPMKCEPTTNGEIGTGSEIAFYCQAESLVNQN